METKKIKKKRFSFKRFLILLLVLYIIAFSVYYLFSLPIKNIVITGNNYVTDAEIIEKAGIKNYPSIFKVSNYSLKKKIKQIDVVDTVSIRKSIFGKLKIIIKEKDILFYNKNNNKYVLDSKTEIDSTNYYGFPVLVNYVPSDIYTKLVAKLKDVNYDIVLLISEIEYSPSRSNDQVIDDTRFLLRMNDGNEAYTNINNLTSLNYYPEIYSTLNNVKGALYLDSSTSENYYFKSFESIKAGDNNEI